MRGALGGYNSVEGVELVSIQDIINRNGKLVDEDMRENPEKYERIRRKFLWLRVAFWVFFMLFCLWVIVRSILVA